MKAVVVRGFGAFENAAIDEFPDPVPGMNDVVIEVEAAEINYPDILMIEGRYQVKPSLPFVPGKGAVGRVVSTGAGATNLAIGQRVAVQVEHGAYAERMRVPRAWCYPVPDGIDADVAAASVLTYQTAWFALTDRASCKLGESVLVLGAGGGVGIATIQLARALGAGLVIADTRGSAKGDFVPQAGADHVVDLTAEGLRDRLRADVQALTGGHGVDVIVDPVGGAVFEPALRALAWRGRLVVVGFTGGEIPVARANYLLVRNLTITGLQNSDYRDRWPDACADAQATIFDYIRQGAVSPQISARYPFERFVDALSQLRQGTARGEVLLVPSIG